MLTCLLPLLAVAQTPNAPVVPAMFPFVIPWDDAVKGTATDVSFLSPGAAGANGPILVRNGHFVESRTGRRIRFFATNVGAGTAFPTRADADRIAARMRKLGINLVRFHHLQNDWDLEGTIWKRDRMQIELDPVMLDRLDYLIAALKRNGIYTNMNLQTTRKYIPELGFPESVRRLPFDFGKRIDKVDRRMIELQKEYAQQLLDRTNPYTGLKYKDDPALAFIEINNENSLVGGFEEAAGTGLDLLPEPFKGEVVARWSDWLKSKYPTRDALLTAWREGLSADGPDLLGTQNRWSWENQSNGDVTFASNPVAGAADELDLTVRSNAGPDWHIQTHLVGLDLKDATTYTVTFEIRSDQNNPVRLAATYDEADWRNIGLNQSFEATPEWKRHTLFFIARGPRPRHSRLAFALGNARGRVQIRGIQLRTGVGNLDLAAGYEEGRVPMAIGGTPRQVADWTDFLTQTEAAYSAEMRRYVRENLGFRRANLVDTQVAWGGLTSLVREAPMDYADNHAYYNHPSFGRTAWDPRDWVVRRSAMVNEMGVGQSNSELGNLAQIRFLGKPYSVSEYNHPSPNDFQAEMMPLVIPLAALQDWDKLYTFAYTTTGVGKPNDQADGFFDTAKHVAKVAFYPASALILRDNLLPALRETETLVLPKSRPYAFGIQAGNVWSRFGTPDSLNRRIAVTTGDVSEPQVRRSKGVATTPIRILQKPKGRVAQIVTNRVAVLSGFVGGETFAERGLKFDFGGFGGEGFAAMMLVPTDRRPLAASKRMLLTLVGRVENTGMGWNPDRTSVSDQWGTAPMLAEGIPGRVVLPNLKGARVFALDGNGRRAREVPVEFARGELGFATGAQFRTVWYEVVRP